MLETVLLTPLLLAAEPDLGEKIELNYDHRTQSSTVNKADTNKRFRMAATITQQQSFIRGNWFIDGDWDKD